MISAARILAAAGWMACFGPPVVLAAEPGYSPYAGISWPRQVLWGDTHLHTGNSLDARLLDLTLDAGLTRLQLPAVRGKRASGSGCNAAATLFQSSGETTWE